jgi:hypothetical protein
MWGKKNIYITQVKKTPHAAAFQISPAFKEKLGNLFCLLVAKKLAFLAIKKP